MRKTLKQRMKSIADNLKARIGYYKLIIMDPRTPRAAKLLLALAIAYALSPIDLVPDFIPVIGHLDDLIIVPLLIILAIKMVPREVLDDYNEN